MNRSERRRKLHLEKKLAKEPFVMRFQFDPAALRFLGPVIHTDVWIADSHARALKGANQELPKPVLCRFLIDSGAYSTIVKHEIAERAALKLINTSSPLRGVGEDHTGRTYFGRFLFSVSSQVAPGTKHIVAVETEITSATLPHAQFFDGLIGRGVLNFFDLRYNGVNGEITMRYLGKRGGLNVEY